MEFAYRKKSDCEPSSRKRSPGADSEQYATISLACSQMGHQQPASRQFRLHFQGQPPALCRHLNSSATLTGKEPVLSKIWKFLNAPIVIVALVILALLFVFRPRIYTPGEPYTVSRAPSQDEDSPGYLTRSSSAGGTHFGYLGDRQYASEVPADAVFRGPPWQPSSGEPPLDPSEAVASIRTELADLIPELADMSVANVNLSEVATGYFIYIVEFKTRDRTSPVGLRLIALMDGTVVRPTISPRDE